MIDMHIDISSCRKPNHQHKYHKYVFYSKLLFAPTLMVIVSMITYVGYSICMLLGKAVLQYHIGCYFSLTKIFLMLRMEFNGND